MKPLFNIFMHGDSIAVSSQGTIHSCGEPAERPQAMVACPHSITLCLDFKPN